MVGCVLSQLKPSELNILSCGKGLGQRPRPSASTFYTAKNVELLGLYPIRTWLISAKTVYCLSLKVNNQFTTEYAES